jgi:nucleotide-binding universal stress UspA family protein
VEQLILGAGVPVLVLPPDPVAGIGQRVLVGWNASCEATRAIHGALPFLVAAERVILCAVGRSAHADLDGALAMLQRHSVPVVPLALEEADASAGETLLIQCYAEGADLLVMGAYGHNRLREFIFGGATRQALHAAALPVLFSA